MPEHSKRPRTFAQQAAVIGERKQAMRLLADLRFALRNDCPEHLRAPVSALTRLYQAALRQEAVFSDSGFLWLGNLWLGLIRTRTAEAAQKQKLYARLIEAAQVRLRALERHAISKDSPCRIYCMAFRNFLDGKPVPEKPLYERDIVIGPEEFLRLTEGLTEYPCHGTGKPRMAA